MNLSKRGRFNIVHIHIISPSVYSLEEIDKTHRIVVCCSLAYCYQLVATAHLIFRDIQSCRSSEDFILQCVCSPDLTRYLRIVSRRRRLPLSGQLHIHNKHNI